MTDMNPHNAPPIQPPPDLTVDQERLKESAFMAKADPIVVGWYSADVLVDGMDMATDDAEFIALATPDVVLCLLAEVEVCHKREREDATIIEKASSIIEKWMPDHAVCAHCQVVTPRDESGMIRQHTLTCEANPLVQELRNVQHERDLARLELEQLRAERAAHRDAAKGAG